MFMQMEKKQLVYHACAYYNFEVKLKSLAKLPKSAIMLQAGSKYAILLKRTNDHCQQNFLTLR